MPDAASQRLFLALWPDAAQREALERHAGAWTWTEAARRTRPERLHVTLHFLGTVSAATVPILRSGLDVRWEGCELLLDRPTVWPPGIAVLEASQVPPALAAFHARLGAQLQALQVPVETRRYRPHVTLARKGFGSTPPAGFQPLAWQAGPGYALVRSLPGGQGYATLQAFG